jgi:hypothetical protein
MLPPLRQQKPLDSGIRLGDAPLHVLIERGSELFTSRHKQFQREILLFLDILARRRLVRVIDYQPQVGPGSFFFVLGHGDTPFWYCAGEKRVGIKKGPPQEGEATQIE